jgi:hypothetical protein
MTFESLRHSRSLAAAAALALGTACSSGNQAADTLETGASIDPISDVSHTPVKRQSIGNCWYYAAATWAESLHRSHVNADINMSETYGSYWHWFEQIANRGVNQVATGGSWGVAVELMSRYGVIMEGDFIPSEADMDRSATQAAAQFAINESLSTGALSTAGARADRALVRQELDRAFSLLPEVSAMLDKVFGAGVIRTLDRSNVSLAGTPLLRTNQIPIGHNGTRALTLADAIGTRASSWNPDVRSGPYAWSEAGYPGGAAARRNLLRRVQRALHDSQPVPVSWFVDFNSLDGEGEFQAVPETIGRQGGHLVVLEDYQIENVPGYGTLYAGQLETRPEALEAALDPSARITFLRIKNSWGVNTGIAGMAGYHDLYMDYLNGPIQYCQARADGPENVDPDDRECISSSPHIPLWSFVLPPGF